MKIIDSVSPNQLKKDYEELKSVRKLARRYNVHHTTIVKAMQQYGLDYKSWGEKIIEKRNMPNLKKVINEVSPILTNPLRLKGDWAITSDWHIPTMSVEWLEILINTSKKYGIKNLIIGGDLLNLDLLSYYWSQKNNIETLSIDKELSIAKTTMRYLEETYDNIVWLLGNHERRLSHTTKYGLAASNMLFLLECPVNKYTINGKSYCYLDDIRITHPKSYTQNKLSVASRLANKFNCHILQAHGHFLSAGYSVGGYVIGDTGGMFDRHRVGYLDEADSTHPIWNNGFFIYKGKRLYMFGEGIGDYETKPQGEKKQ